jgi:hypothetical protein
MTLKAYGLEVCLIEQNVHHALSGEPGEKTPVEMADAAEYRCFDMCLSWMSAQ